MKLIGIDVGLVNLGLCVFDTETNEICVRKVSLLEPKNRIKKNHRYKMSNIPLLVKYFMEDHIDVLNKADVVVIENQMRKSMLLIQYSISSFLIASNILVKFIDPRSVRRFYNISTSNYRQNKLESVRFAPTLLTVKQREKIALHKYSKKDDVCEAIILVFYAKAFNETYENLFISPEKSKDLLLKIPH